MSFGSRLVALMYIHEHPGVTKEQLVNAVQRRMNEPVPGDVQVSLLMDPDEQERGIVYAPRDESAEEAVEAITKFDRMVEVRGDSYFLTDKVTSLLNALSDK